MPPFAYHCSRPNQIVTCKNIGVYHVAYSIGNFLLRNIKEFICCKSTRRVHLFVCLFVFVLFCLISFTFLHISTCLFCSVEEGYVFKLFTILFTSGEIEEIRWHVVYWHRYMFLADCFACFLLYHF